MSHNQPKDQEHTDHIDHQDPSPHSNNHESHDHESMDHSQHKEAIQTLDHSGHGAHGSSTATTMASDHRNHMNHHMAGHNNPTYLFVLIFFVLAGLLFFVKSPLQKKLKNTSKKRWDLFSLPGVELLVRSLYFSFFIRLVPALLFVTVIASGIWGHKRAAFASGMTWLFWWTLLIFFIAFAGKIFCAVCPWDFFANLFQFGGLFPKKKFSQGLNLKFPKWLSNIYPATILFILLTWVELGFDITRNSYVTALLGLSVVGIAIVSALVFKKRSFCRYVCPVGRISGLYSQFSSIELRTRDNQTCKDCVTKDCVKGTEQTTPCPMFLVPYKLDQNTYCTLCTECVRSCDKNNLTLKLRPPSVDLNNANTTRKDEGILAGIMLVLTFFHGLTMTPIWFEWTGSVSAQFGWNYTWSFTLLMSVVLIFSLALIRGFEATIQKIAGWSRYSWALIFSLIPLTLGYHLGHNSMHLLGEILYLGPMLNDPFGYGWNLLGLSQYQPTQGVSHASLTYVQYFCIAVGFYYSVRVLANRTEQLASSPSQQRSLFLGYYALIISLGGLALWFVLQPMVMKSGL